MATQTLTGVTTIFTAPPSCGSSWTYEAETFNSIQGGLLLQNALSVNLDTNCFPAGFAYVGRVADPIQVYSPGVCPFGYATAAESFNGDTTVAVCCQTGFSYTSTFSQKDQFNSTTVLFAGCTSTYPLSSGGTAVPARSGGSGATLNSTTVTGPIIMWGQPISVEFQQTDLILFTTTTTNSASTARSTSVSSQISSAQPSSTITRPTAAPTASITLNPSPPSGLSTGAIAGISIAAGVCVVLILTTMIFFFLRRRKASVKKEPLPSNDDRWRWQRQELDASSSKGKIRAATYRGELDGSDIRLEERSLASRPKAWAELE